MLANIKLKLGAVKLYTVDYSKWLQDTETLTSSVPSVSPTTTPPLTVTADVVQPDQKKVSLVVSGGVAGTDYQIDLVTSSNIPASGGNSAINQTDPQCIGVSVEENCAA